MTMDKPFTSSQYDSTHRSSDLMQTYVSAKIIGRENECARNVLIIHSIPERGEPYSTFKVMIYSSFMRSTSNTMFRHMLEETNRHEHSFKAKPKSSFLSHSKAAFVSNQWTAIPENEQSIFILFTRDENIQ